VSRAVGVVTAVQGLLPDWTALGIALLTQVGGGLFLGLVLTGLYWSRRDLQEDVLLVTATYVVGFGLYRYLKLVFELPRPEQPLLEVELVPGLVRPLYELTVLPASYGFPSGHATSATIIYVGLAAVVTVGTRRLRYAIAGGAVTLVGFTRVALGVHYLVDIVAGVALGGVLLGAVWGLRRVSRDPQSLVLGLGVLTTGLYAVESGLAFEAVVSVGLAVGLFGGWQVVVLARALVGESRRSGTVSVRAGLAAASLAVLCVAGVLGPLVGEWLLVGSVTGVLTAAWVVVPVARHSPHVDDVATELSVAVDR
jgi:membrane-associated phospholipid phosphatase